MSSAEDKVKEVPSMSVAVALMPAGTCVICSNTILLQRALGSVRMKQTLFNLICFLRPSGFSKHSRRQAGKS